MNCKPGDLAMVVGGTVGTQVGKVVTCIRVLRWDEHTVPSDCCPVWLVDVDMVFFDRRTRAHTQHPWCPDKYLMPINPRNDESIEQPETVQCE